MHVIINLSDGMYNWICTCLLQLMSHPFIKKYEDQQVDLAGFVHSVFDPTERLKDLSDVSVLFY